MRKVRVVKRRFLAARSDLVEQVSAIAKGEHKTVYGVVNEALEQFVKAEGMGRSLAEVIDEYSVLKKAREIGSVIIMAEGLWYQMLESVFEGSKDSLIKAWYNTGLWYGKYFAAEFLGQEPFKAVEKVLKVLLWGASDLAVIRSEDQVMVRCIGQKFPLSYTMLLASFLEGIGNALGYKTVGKDVSQGVILIAFKQGY